MPARKVMKASKSKATAMVAKGAFVESLKAKAATKDARAKPAPKAMAAMKAMKPKAAAKPKAEAKKAASKEPKVGATSKPRFEDGTDLVGTKLTYQCENDTWHEEAVRIKVEASPFQEGGMRLAFRAHEIFADDSGIEVVLKCFRDDALDKGDVESKLIENEAKTQMVAEDYAQQFNKLCAQKGLPHCVAFVPVSVVRLRPEGKPNLKERIYSIEPFIPGEYVKYSDNDGGTDEKSDVPVAFSYFTYHVSKKKSVVNDIQGVGQWYTDPQIHTTNGKGFGAGNQGQRGLRRYLLAHTPNLLCEKLGLPSPHAGMTDEELAIKMAADEETLETEE